MTPPALDAGVVATRLRVMRDLLDDLAGLGSVGRDRLEEDRLLRHAVERILTQLVDLAVSVNGHVAAARLGRGPADYRDSFRLAARAGAIDAALADRLRPSVGLRNVLIHEYATVDLDVVARSVEVAHTDYSAFVRQMAAFTGRTTGGQG
jgi:uncharacterized protein YutE (UPF0331/DUF86 family)